MDKEEVLLNVGSESPYPWVMDDDSAKRRKKELGREGAWISCDTRTLFFNFFFILLLFF